MKQELSKCCGYKEIYLIRHQAGFNNDPTHTTCYVKVCIVAVYHTLFL